MDVAAVDIVFRCVITKQTHVKKIGGARQKFKGRKISLVERSGIGPNPADAVLFYQADKLRAMPACVAKFDRKPEIPRQLHQKFPQRLLSVRQAQGKAGVESKSPGVLARAVRLRGGRNSARQRNRGDGRRG